MGVPLLLARDVMAKAPTVDASLMRRIALGDALALRQLFDDASPQVSAVAQKILGDLSDAEDVVQETFCHVWRDAQRFDSSRGTALGWLITIARTRSIDRLRAQ